MIRSPVSYSESAREIVDWFNNLPADQKRPEQWNAEDVAPVRAEIKQHYIGEQNHRCCYCYVQNLTRHGRVWDVEHIVARASHPFFLFEPRNLAVACPDCNNAKSDDPILVNSRIVRYPNRGDRFTIVHPHFDRYEDHIGIIAGRIYWGKSKKGAATICMCNLYRFAAEDAGWDADLLGDDLLFSRIQEMMSAEDAVTQRSKMLEIVAIMQIGLSRTLLQ